MSSTTGGDRVRHWTCAHGIAGIRRDGVVRPAPQPVLGGVALSWWTDLPGPDREALSLTSVTLNCDRMEFCMEAADLSGIVPWHVWARGNPRRRLLERTGMPMHWFVAEVPVPIRGAGGDRR